MSHGSSRRIWPNPPDVGISWLLELEIPVALANWSYCTKYRYLLMRREFTIPIAMYTSCSCVGRPRLYTRVTSKSKHHSKRYIRKPRKISTLNHRSHVAGPAKGRRVARARPAANHRTPRGSNDTAHVRMCHIANAPANREPRRRPATHAGGRISLLAAAPQAVKQATSQLL